jgi:hypothetical protein
LGVVGGVTSAELTGRVVAVTASLNGDQLPPESIAFTVNV